MLFSWFGKQLDNTDKDKWQLVVNSKSDHERNDDALLDLEFQQRKPVKLFTETVRILA